MHSFAGSYAFSANTKIQPKAPLWPIEWVEIEREVFRKQQKLAQLANLHGLKSPQVQRYQNQLIVDLNFRLIAVKGVLADSSNVVRKTIGEKVELVEGLRDLNEYKTKAVYGVGNRKSEIKATILDIPTIKDRCVQGLFKLVLEPVTEVRADTSSFGFRRYRTAHQALAVLHAHLKNYTKSENQAIFDVGIDGFFNNISHEWIIKYLPIPSNYLYILVSWLKGGMFENGV